MHLAKGIHTIGFRKWYERELLQSHAHMVLTFLCFIGAFAAFELMSTPGASKLGNLLLVVLSAGVGAWAVRRYIRLLSSAEAVANQADCPACKTYARFRLVDASVASKSPSVVHVHCKHCDHEWGIETF